MNVFEYLINFIKNLLNAFGLFIQQPNKPVNSSVIIDKPVIETKITNNVMYDYDLIKKTILKKWYKWFDGEMNLNFVWERTSDVITNLFTDFLHVAYTQNGTNKLITLPATTKPGIKGAIDSPITYEGVTGTAVIIPDQYVSSWEFHDTTTEFSEYPYFRQVKGIKYWRDGDKDLIVDHIQEQDNKIFNTHWHRMSNIGTYGSGFVNNWSLGCMGCPEPIWYAILPLVRESIKVYGKTFTGTVIESKDFIN
jgi:hypothetical protein